MSLTNPSQLNSIKKKNEIKSQIPSCSHHRSPPPPSIFNTTYTSDLHPPSIINPLEPQTHRTSKKFHRLLFPTNPPQCTSLKP
ncbi:hypothetical protein LguiA_016312 [Lonicera macranthoides]